MKMRPLSPESRIHRQEPDLCKNQYGSFDYIFVSEGIVELDDGSESEFKIVTAVERKQYKHTIGGARCVTSLKDEGESANLNLDCKDSVLGRVVVEACKLAASMTKKGIVTSIPCGGQKTVFFVSSDHVAKSAKLKADLLEAHIRFATKEFNGLIFGPDINIDEEVQGLLSKREGLLSHITGLSPEDNGLGIDTNGYTASGILDALEFWVGFADLKPARLSIEGFGSVGANFAKKLKEKFPEIAVVAVSNQYGTIYTASEAGLDIDYLYRVWESFSLKDRDSKLLESVKDEVKTSNMMVSAYSKKLFEVPVDVFVPAARTATLCMRDEDNVENEAPKYADEFYEATKPKLILEAANNPLTKGARRYLENKGVSVLTDFIINTAGVIGCYVEWMERGKDEPFDFSNSEKRAGQIIKESIVGTMKSVVESDVYQRTKLFTVASEEFIKNDL